MGEQKSNTDEMALNKMVEVWGLFVSEIYMQTNNPNNQLLFDF